MLHHGNKTDKYRNCGRVTGYSSLTAIREGVRAIWEISLSFVSISGFASDRGIITWRLESKC